MAKSIDLDQMLVLETDSMRDALRVIDRTGTGIAFAVDSEKVLQGVVTDGDIRRAILMGKTLESKISEFMTSHPISVTMGTPLEVVIGLMSNKIKFIPVVDKEGFLKDYAAFSQAVHLPIASPSFPGNELKYVTECVLTNWISSQGRFVDEFERAFSKFCGVQHCIAVSNGTMALHLALLLANVGPGDEVIVPTFTFIATANAVSYTGAKPIFVDSECESWNLDPKDVEQKITSSTKAIIPVHLYGRPAQMDPIMKIAKKHRLCVIEDAAEAHGADYQGKPVGSIGDMGCFSFFGNKIITTGEGGMVTTNNVELANKARLLRDHGMSKSQKYWYEMIGYNYRLTNLQAAIGLAQTERVEEILTKRAEIETMYRQFLEEEQKIEIQKSPSWGNCVTWLFTVLLQNGIDRDKVIGQLKNKGIDSRPTFFPLHRMPPYINHINPQEFPVAEDIASRGICLPTSTEMGESDIMRVCDTLKASIH